MSKRSNAATQQPAGNETQRLGCTLDAQTYLLINTMAAFRGVPTAQIVSEGVWTLLDQHQNKEKESFLSVLRAKFGRICRPFSKIQSDTTVGQGIGSSSEPEPDGLAERTKAVNRMADRFVNATDTVLDSLAN